MSIPAYAQPLLMVVTAAASLALTVGAWDSARVEAERGARTRFELRAVEIVAAIPGRMLDYEQALRGAAGLFAASESVERREWQAYVESLHIERAYPGIEGIGFAPHVAAEGKGAVEAVARADGIADYAVFPPGERPAHVPVLYLLPLTERNRRALGFDMYAEAARRRAMNAARDAGEPAITSVVTLVQETASDSQPGVLMYLPVYRDGAPAKSARERGRALAGFVFSAFRLRDLMTGIVGQNPGVELRLTDVTDPGAPAVLFHDAGAGRAGPRSAPRFTKAESLAIRDRLWRLDVASLPAYEAEIDDSRPCLILGAGLAISALLLLIVWTLLTTRARAREMARNMTTALRESEERLQLALASSSLALFDWNVASGLVHLSREWSVMLGGPAEPTLVPIQKLQMLVHPEDAPAVEAEVGELLAGKTDGYRVQHRVRRFDETWKWIESVARVNERDAAGRALRITGANADIDERKALEQMKSEFIATVSHELRTPLTSMLGSLALLREGSAGTLTADATQFVEIAYANTERLAALVNDILAIERIESGGLELHLRTLDTGEMLRRAAELNRPYAERHGISFVVSEPAELLAVVADADRLLQVLTNLLSNAAKFSPAGSEVTLAALGRGTQVRISVTDRGPGVPAAFRARLFGRFEQADRTRGGSGLGLAISKALVEQMHGRIGCDGEPGQGATFWVELPKGGAAPR